MLPTINKRFLLILVAVVVALTAAVVGLHAVQSQRIPDALRAQSERSVAADKPDQAVHYLRQYLEFRPDDAEVMEQLGGLLRRRSGDNPRSLLELLRLYERTLRADPDRHATRREAVLVALNPRLGRYTDAETHATYLLKQFPDDAGLWRSLAAAQAKLNKPADCKASLEAAIRVAPQDTISYQELAGHLYAWGEKAESLKVLDKLVAARPKDPESLLSRAKFFVLQADEKRAAASPGDADDQRAISDLKKVLEFDKQNANALLMLAGRLDKGKDLAGARDLLAEGMKKYPDDARFVRQLSWLELNRGNLGAAVSVLEEGLEKAKDQFDLLVPLADLLVQLGDTDRTRDIVRKLEARKGPMPAMQAKYLTGRLAMRETNWDDAIRVFTALRTDAVTYALGGLENQANLLLSVCHHAKGDVAQEEDVLKRITAEPNRLPALVALGNLYLNQGRFDDAVRQYEEAAKSPYASGASISTLMKMKASRLRMRSAAPRDWDVLMRELSPELLARFGTSSAEPSVLRAEVTSARGAKDQAVAILRAEAMKRPTDARLWALLGLATAELGGVSAGLSILDEAQAVCGDGPDLRLARASLYARDPARLRPIGPLAVQIDLWPESEQNRLLAGLIEVYDRLADDAGVLRTYRRMAGRNPTDVALWEVLFERATLVGDTKAQAEARTMLAKLPNGNRSAALLTAWEVLAAKKPEAAPAAIAELEKQYGTLPNRGDACVALARLKALDGNPTAAGILFARAVVLEPTRFGPTQDYLAFLTAAGDDEKLNALLTRLTQDHRWCGEPLRRAVRQTVARVEPVAAKRLLDLTRRSVERDPDGLGWLGECYAACGFKADAADRYEAAVASPLATPDDWLRLMVRTADGESAKLDAVVKRARAKLTPNQFLATAAAFADSAVAPKNWKPELDAPTDMRKYAQARLAIKLSRYEKSEAIDLLETFLNEKAVPKGDAAWGRRNLAMLLAARGTPSDRTKAKELLADKAAPVGDTADEKRATAAVLAGLSRHLGGDDRQAALDRAVEVLAEVARETENKRDKFLLAQLLRTSGKRADGRKLLSELIQADSDNIDFLIAGLDESTQEDDKPFAEGCIARLLARYPNEYRAVVAAARYRCRTKAPDQALALALNYARTANANPGDLQARMSRAAELLDELCRLPDIKGQEIGRKMTNAAVEKYEAMFVTRPEAIIAAAGLLAADARPADGFARIEKYTKQLPTRVKVLAGLAVLQAGGATDAQFATVRGWIDAAKNEEPNSVAVLLNEGNFCSLKQDLAGAEKAYQAALDLDDRNVVALNNLAWILSAKPDASDRAMQLVDRAVGEIGLTGELLDTRARVKIAKKQFEAAEQDLRQALLQEKTPLRMFHLAYAQDGRKPKGDAKSTFLEAKKQGLQEQRVHPDDVPVFRDFDKRFGGAN